MSSAETPASPPRLPAYGAFAALLAAAGLPIYIHAPKFYVDEYGVSLASLGAVLFSLRLIDVVQDPVLGRLADRLRDRRSFAVAIGVAVIIVGMLGLFAIAPPIAPLLWFALMLTLVFSAFSFLTINFYAQGVAKAEALGPKGHLRLARWRETGGLLGVCAAAIAPVALASWLVHPFAGFAIGFAVLSILAGVAMRSEWETSALAPSDGFAPVLRDSLARRLLLIAFLNAAPVAVSSTLFLFFVESRLNAPGMEGPLLLLFFLSAAAAVPVWSRLAEVWGTKAVLMGAMVLAIASFGGAFWLGSGDVWAFAAVCVGSGAAMGADLTLLPAAFARRMSEIAPAAAEGFGLWSFVSKLTLAFAAIILLPALQGTGFDSGAENSEAALWLLSFFYACVPCVLKLAAIVMLAATDLREQ